MRFQQVSSKFNIHSQNLKQQK